VGQDGDRMMVEERLSTPVQTGPEAHPTSYTIPRTMGAGSFLGVEGQGRCADHPPPCSAEVKERVQLYCYSPSGPSWPDLGCTFPLPY